MADLLSASALWAIILTVSTYQFGLFLRKKTGLALCNPILISALLIIVLLLFGRIPVETYQAGIQSISWLLTPCTVALGIPLYTQLNKLRGHIAAILTGILAGTAASLLLIAVLCSLLGLDQMITVSLLPKSITTAMAIPLTERAGGIVPLTTSAVIISGILGSIAGETVCRLLHIHHPIAKGVAYGTGSHVIGTSRATEVDSLSGAVGSLSLVIAGIATAIAFALLRI